jgi:uncharacterized Zn finger protein
MARTAAPAHGWWGTQWLEYMVHEHLHSPLTSGQIKGAERGDAVFTFGRGQVSVCVEVGSYGSTETATLKVKPLGEREWKRVVGALAERPDVARRLLSGAPGAELAQAFDAADVPLFPTPSGRSLRCSCREDWGCRHVRVLAVRGAPMLDLNPFLWLQVLGRSREDLLAAVRARLADQAGSEQGKPEAALLSVSPERFLATETDPVAIPVRPGSSTTPDALLRMLGPIPLPAEQSRFERFAEVELESGGITYEQVVETADEVLARFVQQISSGAAELAAGDRAPRHFDEPLPGKRVPLKQRLVPEIEEAVGRAEGCVYLGELWRACPTAAALPWNLAAKALREAWNDLPEEYVILAGHYVARRSGLLAGTTFRHVITFSEWHSGQLDLGADWAWMMGMAGFAAPYPMQIGQATCQSDQAFDLLALRVGDELQITVADPMAPLLFATLQRREKRSLTAALDIDREAATLVARHLEFEEEDGIEYVDAVELLFAHGFYREGRCPDAAWLLPAPAVGNQVYWGYHGALTAQSWRRTGMAFDQYRFGIWHDRQNTLNQFAGTLLQAGLTRKEVDQALAFIEVWIRHWPGDQRQARHAPTLGALLHFLWNAAPVETRRVRLAPEWVPFVMGRWFRLLSEQNQKLEPVFEPHIAACDQAEAYAYRQATLPVGRNEGAAMEAWLMEGYRWIGRELCLGRQGY